MNGMTEAETREPDQEAGRDEGPGARLRRLREARELTVEEVADRLFLEVRIVEALEADRHEALPAPVFVRGYLRQYARLLDTDPAPLLAAYHPPADQSTAGAVRTRRRRRAGLRLPAVRVPWRALLLGLLLGVLGWAAYRFGPDLVAAWQARTADSPETEVPGEATLPLPPPPSTE